MRNRTNLFDMAHTELKRRAKEADNSVVLEEMGRQPYTDTTFSAGLVQGHKHDTIYLKLERATNPLTLLLRRDEALTIMWLLSGALWSEQMQLLGSEHE